MAKESGLRKPLFSLRAEKILNFGRPEDKGSRLHGFALRPEPNNGQQI